MDSSFINELLVDPITGEKLFLNSSTNIYHTTDGMTTYPLINSIPKILTNEQLKVRSKIHKEQDSEFNYTQHYQNDAVLDDYSENNIPAVTRYEFKRLRESILNEVTSEMILILDVGCGNGWVAKSLLPMNKKIISMDISSINPSRVVKDLPHKNHAGLIADVFFLPIKENSIDCVIASEIIEHVPDPGLLISNLLKVLKKGGKLIITTPYNEVIEYFLCVHCNKPTPKSAHLHSFNEENIKKFIPNDCTKVGYVKLINRYLSKFRTYLILQFVPYPLWRFIDRHFNFLFKNPTRLLLIIEKS
jgi:2-polyprenyl-3-methyl-5-hydroxy-6-metoxy-1,4-benzoquinol methylase